MVCTHALFLWNVRSRFAKADPDFTAFYTAGKLLRQGRGGQLYNPYAQAEVQQEFTADPEIRRGPLPYVHPPFEALLFLPFTFLPYPQALAAWEGLNLGLLIAVALLLRSSLSSLQTVPLWEWMLALLAFFPVFADFLQGQDAILLLLLFALSFRALDAGDKFMAGCWLGLGVFRFHLVLPLVLLFLWWRYRKVVAGFAVTASAAGLVSLAIVGWQRALEYPAYIWRWSSTPGIGNMPPSLMPNLAGLFTGWPISEGARWPFRMAAIAASAALLLEVARLGRSRDQWPNTGASNHDEHGARRLSLACAVIAAVLVAYNTGSYDLCLLILPLAWIADYCLRRLPELAEARRKILLPAVPLLLSPLWFLLWRRWERINLMAIFLLWWIYAIRREILRLGANAAGRVEPLT